MHIGIAVAVLTIAFALAFSDFFAYSASYIANPSLLAQYFLAAFVAVGTGFLLHELAHKMVAQRYGCWAEFRSDRMGLLLALITSFFGIVFAAPGAVYIAGGIDKEQNGKISLSGPLTNVFIAVGFIGLFFLFLEAGLFLNEPFVYFLLSFVAQVNLFLAGFNMIPFMPFDGAKVVRWNAGIYVGMLIVIIGLYLYFFTSLF
jgi:Zn-dependent protease